MRDNYENYVVPVTAGCVSNVVGVVSSLGPWYFAYRRQSSSPTSYGNLILEFKSRLGWSQAYKSLVPAVQMAPLQSLGYNSVVIYYTETYKKSINPEDPNSVKVPLSVAARAGFYSAATETAFSVHYLKKVFDKWNRTHLEHNSNGSTFSRIFTMTLIKNGIANPATVLGVYSVKLQFDRMLGDENSKTSVCENSAKLTAIAGFIGALGANFGFAPVVTLQTRVLEKPQHTIGWHATKLWGEGKMVLWAGVGARSVAKAIQSAVGFGLVPLLSAALSTNNNRFFAKKTPALPVDQPLPIGSDSLLKKR